MSYANKHEELSETMASSNKQNKVARNRLYGNLQTPSWRIQNSCFKETQQVLRKLPETIHTLTEKFNTEIEI
jgi:hypothetical protein